jgi:hypothetical protein
MLLPGDVALRMLFGPASQVPSKVFQRAEMYPSMVLSTQRAVANRSARKCDDRGDAREGNTHEALRDPSDKGDDARLFAAASACFSLGGQTHGETISRGTGVIIKSGLVEQHGSRRRA